jgi:hypothetical protein
VVARRGSVGDGAPALRMPAAMASRAALAAGHAWRHWRGERAAIGG